MVTVDNTDDRGNYPGRTIIDDVELVVHIKASGVKAHAAKRSVTVVEKPNVAVKLLNGTVRVAVRLYSHKRMFTLGKS